MSQWMNRTVLKVIISSESDPQSMWHMVTYAIWQVWRNCPHCRHGKVPSLDMWIWPILRYYTRFWARSQNCEKRLLASSCLSGCPAGCHLGTTRLPLDNWTDFRKILCLRILRKSVDKIQVSLKSDKNNGYFTRIPIHFINHISLNSFSNEKCCG